MIIAETAVKYNPSARHWETWDDAQPYEQALIVGGVTAFPAGREGQRAALLAAIRHDSPITAQFVDEAIEAHPDDEAYIDRVIAAGLIVKNNGVYRVRGRRYGSIIAHVESQSKPGTYHDILWGDNFICPCDDFQYRPNREKLNYMCKHTLAVLILAKIDRQQFDEVVEAQIERELEKRSF